MSGSERVSFIFAVCQVGAEPALKKELAQQHPELKFAYSRPGFITFKCEGKTLEPDFALRSVFARAYGLTVFKMTPKEGGFRDKAKRVLEHARTEGKFLLHVWERDQHVPGEEPKGFLYGDWTESAVVAIREEAAAGGFKISINEPAAVGADILDLVVVDENEWWLGTHKSGVHHSPYPGGRPTVVFPPEAPSRAYVKLEEGLLWSGAQLRTDDVAVEIGSAPGGASYSLLQRGLVVVGIDPAAMHPRVLEHENFEHIQKPIAAVRRDELPPSVQWLLLDMNVAPGVSLFAIDRLATSMKDSLLGLLLTVKLNQWKFADQIPSMLEHIRSMGMIRAKATQLASNGQEIFIYALTRKGSVRP